MVRGENIQVKPIDNINNCLQVGPFRISCKASNKCIYVRDRISFEGD